MFDDMLKEIETAAEEQDVPCSEILWWGGLGFNHLEEEILDYDDHGVMLKNVFEKDGVFLAYEWYFNPSYDGEESEVYEVRPHVRPVTSYERLTAPQPV